jgi:hypothetical protein
VRQSRRNTGLGFTAWNFVRQRMAQQTAGGAPRISTRQRLYVFLLLDILVVLIVLVLAFGL